MLSSIFQRPHVIRWLFPFDGGNLQNPPVHCRKYLISQKYAAKVLTFYEMGNTRFTESMMATTTSTGHKNNRPISETNRSNNHFSTIICVFLWILSFVSNKNLGILQFASIIAYIIFFFLRISQKQKKNCLDLSNILWIFSWIRAIFRRLFLGIEQFFVSLHLNFKLYGNYEECKYSVTLVLPISDFMSTFVGDTVFSREYKRYKHQPFSQD